MDCPTCTREPIQTPDGLPCQRCCDQLISDLGMIATDWADLILAIAKQANTSDRMGSGSGVPAESSPVDLGALDVRDNAENTLVGWVRVLCEDCGFEPPVGTIYGIASWLKSHLLDLRRHPANQEIWQEIHREAMTVRHVIDRDDREYLGECPECGGIVRAKAGAHMGKCSRCGAMFDADATRTERLEWSDAQMVTQAELARFIPRQSISRWILTGQLLSIGTLHGKPAYRLGDARILRERHAGVTSENN